jgi:hypothetical protein
MAIHIDQTQKLKFGMENIAYQRDEPTPYTVNAEETLELYTPEPGSVFVHKIYAELLHARTHNNIPSNPVSWYKYIGMNTQNHQLVWRICLRSNYIEFSRVYRVPV